jgi:hypothetical protein
MRETNIQISKSNIIDSLMPLLLSTSIVNEGEKIKDIAFLTDQSNIGPNRTETMSVHLIIEKEN